MVYVDLSVVQQLNYDSCCGSIFLVSLIINNIQSGFVPPFLFTTSMKMYELPFAVAFMPHACLFSLFSMSLALSKINEKQNDLFDSFITDS